MTALNTTRPTDTGFRDHPEDTCFRFTGGIKWEARRQAEAWCRARGFSYGPAVRGQPSGIMRGAWTIAPWPLLSEVERRRLDGVITSHSFEMGPVVIRIRKRAAQPKRLFAE